MWKNNVLSPTCTYHRRSFITYLNGNKNSKSFSCIPLSSSFQIHEKKKLLQRNFSFDSTIIGIWKTISDSTPVAYIQNGLVSIHDFTGLPWWTSIILSTFLFRTIITLPLAIYQNKMMARIQNITLEMPQIVAELKKETAIAIKKFNWSKEQAKFAYNRSLKKQWQNLIVRDNCHPAKTFIVLWGQIPLWILNSIAIRNLVSMLPDPSSPQANSVYMEMTLEGFGWIPNLTEPDVSYILPLAVGLINLSIIQTQIYLRTSPASRLQAFATNFFRILSILMVPISASVPSCLCLYWLTSSAYGFTQNLILIAPKFRRIVGIPKTSIEIQNPYDYILHSAKTKAFWKS